MANQIICDICGKECKDSGFYKLTYISWPRKVNKDLCYDCMTEIKQAIKDKSTKHYVHPDIIDHDEFMNELMEEKIDDRRS